MNTHKFFYDENERVKFQNPKTILSESGLKPGHTFMDIGCGDGFFSIPAAKIVGEKGKVYCLDIDNTAMKKLREKAEKENLRNLNLTVGEAEKNILCEACADMVFFGIVLHDFKDTIRVFN